MSGRSWVQFPPASHQRCTQCVTFVSSLASLAYRAKTSCFSIQIVWLNGISGHLVTCCLGILVGKHYSATMVAHCNKHVPSVIRSLQSMAKYTSLTQPVHSHSLVRSSWEAAGALTTSPCHQVALLCFTMRPQPSHSGVRIPAKTNHWLTKLILVST